MAIVFVAMATVNNGRRCIYNNTLSPICSAASWLFGLNPMPQEGQEGEEQVGGEGQGRRNRGGRRKEGGGGAGARHIIGFWNLSIQACPGKEREGVLDLCHRAVARVTASIYIRHCHLDYRITLLISRHPEHFQATIWLNTSLCV